MASGFWDRVKSHFPFSFQSLSPTFHGLAQSKPLQFFMAVGLGFYFLLVNLVCGDGEEC